mgnify:CR=1 FL=1
MSWPVLLTIAAGAYAFKAGGALLGGRFADAALSTLSDTELTELERLMEIPDQVVLGWVTGESAAPAEYDTALFRRLREFHHGNKSGG